MTDNNSKILRGLLLGGAIIGAGIYISRNKELKQQLSTKLKDGMDSLNKETSIIQDKIKTTVDSTKTTLDKSYHDVKESFNAEADKLTKQINELINRLNESFSAGKEAAKDSLRKSEVVGEDFKLRNKEMNLGAVEDTTVDNSSELHPATTNVAQNIDVTENIDDTASSLNKMRTDKTSASKEHERFDG